MGVGVDVGDPQAPLIDLDDPELMNAMQIFANMNPEEMEATAKQLKEMLGDDPETLAAIDQVLAEIPKIKDGDGEDSVKRSLKQMVADDEVAAATHEALKMLQHADAWEQIWEKRDLILDAVIASGQISDEDAIKFKADSGAWENELKFIWGELKKQAADQKASES